jgi:hypothetical protein
MSAAEPRPDARNLLSIGLRTISHIMEWKRGVNTAVGRSGDHAVPPHSPSKPATQARMTTESGTWKPVAREEVLNSNPKPILYVGSLPNGFWVLPWNTSTGSSLNYSPRQGFIYWMGLAIGLIPGVGTMIGLALMSYAAHREEREILKQVGWTKTGRDQTQYGRYEQHKRKLFFIDPYTGRYQANVAL